MKCSQFYTEIELSQEIKDDIVSDARYCYPDECCGLIIGDRYFRILNVAKNPKEGFEFDLYEFTKLVNKFGFASIRAVCHSHPNESNPFPSERDKLIKENYGFNLVICGVYNGDL